MDTQTKGLQQLLLGSLNVPKMGPQQLSINDIYLNEIHRFTVRLPNDQ